MTRKTLVLGIAGFAAVVLSCSGKPNPPEELLPQGESACGIKPVGSFEAHVVPVGDGEPFDGTVSKTVIVGGEAAQEFTVTLEDSLTRTISVSLPALVPGFTLSGPYQFVVENKTDDPAKTGLFITDPAGLVFAGTTTAYDPFEIQDVKEAVIFKMSSQSAECEAREGDECYDSFTNQKIQFEHGGESVSLMQAEAAAVGDYWAVVLTAQTVKKKTGCTEDTAVTQAYLILRADAITGTGLPD